MAKQQAQQQRCAGDVEGNVVGIDPHKKTLTASVLDARGGVLGTMSFKVSGDGHRAMQEWTAGLGLVQRAGIEGASGLGRHTSVFLIQRGLDVRDVNPNRTAESARKRRQGKTDALDSVRVAREAQADPDMPVVFKRATGDAGPDETTELMALWHKARRSNVEPKTPRENWINRARTKVRSDRDDSCPLVSCKATIVMENTRPVRRSWPE